MKSKRRILIIVDRWSSGGVPVVISSHCRQLVKRGCDVRIVTYYPSENPQLKDVDFISLNARARGDFKVIKNIRRILAEWSPDIIHDHFGGLWAATYLMNAKWRQRAILHYHNEYKAVKDSPDDNRVMRDSFFLKFLLPRYALVLTVSKHNRYRLQEHAKLSKSQLETLYNSIDPQQFITGRSSGENIRKTLEIPQNALLIGSIGRLVYEKGFDTVLEVLISLHRKKTKAYGLITGDGDPKISEQLSSRAEKAGVAEYFRLIGREPNTADYLKSLDYFLMCSRQEPFGLTILEAMSCNVPVTGVTPEAGGGPPEIITNGENGWLLQHRDPDGIASKVIELQEDAQQRRKLIEGGQQTVMQFSDEQMGERLMEMYDRVTSGIIPKRKT